MNKYLLSIYMIVATITVLYAQNKAVNTLYDDWPTTVVSNERSAYEKINGISPRWVEIGTVWDQDILNYFFINGTNDIAGDDERNAIRQGFDIWEVYADIVFHEVCDVDDADVVFLWAIGDHGDGGPFDGQNGVLAHTLGGPPPNDFGDNAGDVHFDDAETWTLNSRQNNQQPIDLVTIAAHEIGHMLGLDHTEVSGSLMLANYTGSHRYLGSDDFLGIQHLYGAAPSTRLNGPALICTTGIFTLNLPPEDVTWQVTPTNLVSPSSGTGPTANVSKISNGNANITFTNDCSGDNIESRSFHTGPYSSSDYPITGPSSTSCNSYVYYSIPQLTGVTSINWTWPTGWTYVSGQGTRYLALRTGTYGGAVAVGVNNTCGQSGSYATKYTSVYGCYGPFGYTIFPNPASSQLVIELTDLESKELVSAGEFSIDQVSIMNHKMEIVLLKTFKGSDNRNVTLDVSNINAGTVYLKVKVGEYEFTERVVIDK